MIYTVIFLISIFLTLLYFVLTKNSTLFRVDEVVLSYFHNIQTKSLDIFFATITWFGSLWILAPLYVILFFYLLKSGYQNLSILTIGFIGAISTTYIAKYLLARERPSFFETVGDAPFDPSFPSAHTTQALISLFVISYLLIDLNIESKFLYISIFTFIAIAVLISRMYLQVHYFSDILGGILVVSIWALALLQFIKIRGF